VEKDNIKTLENELSVSAENLGTIGSLVRGIQNEKGSVSILIESPTSFFLLGSSCYLGYCIYKYIN